MRISIVNNLDTAVASQAAVNSLVKAAKEKGIECNVTDLLDLHDLESWVGQLGDVVIYRWASVTQKSKARTKVYKYIRSRRVLINDVIADFPDLRWKDWQQQYIGQQTNLETIPTWSFKTIGYWNKAVASKELTWPLIQKPRGGVMGRDVYLLSKPIELKERDNIKRYIFQPWLENDGDYRVLIIGGIVVGVMKRTAAEGEVANNIGQGGKGSKVENKAIVQQLKTMAGKVHKAIPLDILGIDILQNKVDGKYYFLELNVTPQWDEFTNVTGIPVGQMIIELCQQKYEESLVK